MTILKITYVSKSGKSAIGVVQKKFGFATTMVASGWLKVDEGTAVGDTVELPEDIKVSVVAQPAAEPNADGETVEFNWLVLGE